jgi:hypothetical protein
MKIAKWIVTGALAVPMAAGPALADEKKPDKAPAEMVKMADLPAPVKATVERESKGKTVESIKKETENGKTAYDVEIVADGKGQQIEVSEAGKVLKRGPMHDEKTEAEHHDQKY